MPLQNDKDVSCSSFTPAFGDFDNFLPCKNPSTRSNPCIKMPAESRHWPKVDDTFPSNLQREQPQFLSKGSTKGDKYQLIIIINNSIQKLTADSGAYLSVMHKKKAIELGLRLFDVPEIAARAASGPLSMNQSAVATIDYGVVVANTTFAICDLDSYSPDLILLGSNALKDLGMVANFETNMVHIKQKYPIRMYTNRESAEQHIMQINVVMTSKFKLVA